MVSPIDEKASAMPCTLHVFISVVLGLYCWSLLDHWCDVNDVLYSSYNVTKQSKLSSTVLICGGSHWPRCEKWDVPAYTNC